ncbi:hypothetical protein PHLGIDRAFT_184043 [Phlebiopsis gigantea 11061_1 CR5-6]|uniref:Uncharacterized protein n=1 Tax=Phlebiopsis gigantea (strain 11061_1 CR5-6) TaxID=745531 RepID=A0A0C3NZJ7_PHLG1|nr:hypothetical protein PHLGIDRAFT_184043 [Phlebiopsis gigantea 11061_1 CR5-6]
MLSPKQKRATLMRVSFCERVSRCAQRCGDGDAHRSEVVEDVALRLVREDEIGGDGEGAARHKRHGCRDVRDFRKPVERRRLQAAVDEQRVVVADEREADHADGLEQPGAEHGEPLRRVALQVGRDVRALDEHRRHDDHHADEREPRRARELVDVAVEREGVRDAYRAQRNDELAVREQGQDGHGVQVGKYRTDDVG